jgi:hypothetical protein
MRKSRAGRKPMDAVVMFRTLVLGALYNLSEDQIGYQMRDRLSFMRFLGLGLEDRIPDARTAGRRWRCPLAPALHLRPKHLQESGPSPGLACPDHRNLPGCCAGSWQTILPDTTLSLGYADAAKASPHSTVPSPGGGPAPRKTAPPRDPGHVW